MEIEIIETGARMSVRDWYAAHPCIAFGQPLTNLVLKEAHEVFEGVPLARIVPPEPQPEPVPQTISPAQGKAALINAGMWEPVLEYVAAIADAKERALAEVALHATQEWRRSSPFLNAAALALGITAEQLDALFTAGAAVEL